MTFTSESTLKKQGTGHFYITPVIAGEIACGTSMEERETWRVFLAPFEMLAMDAATAWHYGEILRSLAASGTLIGTNDLWIAASGLAHDEVVATGNIDEFRRVNGLEVVKV